MWIHIFTFFHLDGFVFFDSVGKEKFEIANLLLTFKQILALSILRLHIESLFPLTTLIRGENLL